MPERHEPAGRSIPTLSTLLRLWALRRPDDLPARATERSLIGLGAACLFLWIGLDRWHAGPGASFEPLEAPLIAVYLVMLLVIAYLASRASRPRIGFRITLFVALGFAPLLIGAGFWIGTRLEGPSAVAAWTALSVYALLYFMRALRFASGRWQPRSAAAAIMVLGVFSTAYRASDLTPSMWAPAPVEEQTENDLSAADAEAVMFDQRDMIDEAVDRMKQATGPQPAVYFIGFAGVSSQRVFAEEIELAAQVVGERFDDADRQLLLINDRRDLDTYPLATVSGLRYALSAVAQKMDPERDILFLALSSHGSSDPLLEVSNGGLPLAQLGAEDLESALRESGIKRRIIVISACYAGGFMQSLESPDTIVIAAAAADRTSFGCSDDRDLTYFGEAFYRDALPASASLQDAFARARAAIAAREKREGEIPSDPQAFFGDDISKLLERYPMRAAGTRWGGTTARAAGELR